MGERESLSGVATLATKHEKQHVIARALAPLGVTVEVVRFDTDTLGTFTRDVPRAGSQLEAARAKAQVGAQFARTRYGLGSEGSFSASTPWGPLINVELVLWLDVETGHEVIGRASGVAHAVSGTARSLVEFDALAQAAKFPSHGLVLRVDDEHHAAHKDFRSVEELYGVFEALRAESRSGQVFVESDCRAHRHPSRMERIAHAAKDLAERLARSCPNCGARGWGPTGGVPGLPCRECGTLTERLRARRWSCRCGYAEEQALEEQDASPAHCPTCNP